MLARMPLRLLVVDDSPEMRACVVALCSLLREVEVVGVVASAFEALDVVERRAVDVVLMDIRMPGMDGFEGTRRLKASRRPPQVVLFTTHEAEAYAEAALAAGAEGLLRKLDLRGELLPMIRHLDSRRSM